MPVTAGVLDGALRAVRAGTRLIRSLDVLAQGADAALRMAPPGLTAAGAASFLATQIQESDFLRSTEEYGGRDADYAPHWGRTFEMITWDTNYGYFGQWCYDRDLVADPRVFVRDPAELTSYRWAWLGGVWYFEHFGLWRLANLGDHYKVSQAVNRGINSVGTDAVPRNWSDRLNIYTALRQYGDALLPRDDDGDGAALRRRRGLLLN